MKSVVYSEKLYNEKIITYGIIYEELDRINISVPVSKNGNKALSLRQFKLDSGSDIMIMSYKSLVSLGYAEGFLNSNRNEIKRVSTVSTRLGLPMKYVPEAVIRFGGYLLFGVRLYYSITHDLHNLLGNDVLRYFDYEINHKDKEMYVMRNDRVPDSNNQGDKISFCFRPVE